MFMWTGIALLYWLQDIRLANPILEDIFTVFSSRVFYLVLPIVVAFIFYWCINKRQGEIIGMGCVSAMVFSMLVKFGIGIPRPWDLDPRIIEVQGVHANGLSCPSGHTAVTSAAFGASAVFSKHLLSKIVLILMIAMIISARLILCVHTPLDIIVGMAIGIAAALVAWKAVDYSYTSDRAYWIVAIAYGLFFAVFFAVSFFCWGADAGSLTEYMGFLYGALVGRALEYRYVGYEVPDTGLKNHVMRYIIGMVVGAAILGVFMILVPSYGTLIGGFLMLVWAFYLYPKIMKGRNLFL